MFPRTTIKIQNCLAVVDWRTGKPTLNRRPKVSFEGENWIGHRLAFHLNVKPIPRNPGTSATGIILHSCDNGWCVNFKHLRIGTHQDNMNDLKLRHHFRLSRKASINAKRRFKDPRQRRLASQAAKKRWSNSDEVEKLKLVLNCPSVKALRSISQLAS